MEEVVLPRALVRQHLRTVPPLQVRLRLAVHEPPENAAHVGVREEPKAVGDRRLACTVHPLRADDGASAGKHLLDLLRGLLRVGVAVERHDVAVREQKRSELLVAVPHARRDRLSGVYLARPRKRPPEKRHRPLAEPAVARLVVEVPQEYPLVVPVARHHVFHVPLQLRMLALVNHHRVARRRTPRPGVPALERLRLAPDDRVGVRAEHAVVEEDGHRLQLRLVADREELVERLEEIRRVVLVDLVLHHEADAVHAEVRHQLQLAADYVRREAGLVPHRGVVDRVRGDVVDAAPPWILGSPGVRLLDAPARLGGRGEGRREEKGAC